LIVVITCISGTVIAAVVTAYSLYVVRVTTGDRGNRAMLRKEKLHLLPVLLVAAENDDSPVTYVVLSMRLCGLGGDRACRGYLEELRNQGFVDVERQRSNADQREKVVRLTDAGWDALGRFSEILSKVREMRGSGQTATTDDPPRLRLASFAAND